MSRRELKVMVRQVVGGIMGVDGADLFRYVTDDVKYKALMAKQNYEVNGKEELRRMLSPHPHRGLDVDMCLRDMVVDGDKVIALVETSFEHDGEFMSREGTGEVRCIPFAVDVDLDEDSRLVKSIVFYGDYSALTSLGTHPPHKLDEAMMKDKVKKYFDAVERGDVEDHAKDMTDKVIVRQLTWVPAPVCFGIESTRQIVREYFEGLKWQCHIHGMHADRNRVATRLTMDAEPTGKVDLFGKEAQTIEYMSTHNFNGDGKIESVIWVMDAFAHFPAINPPGAYM